jgi:hypothetical protein
VHACGAIFVSLIVAVNATAAPSRPFFVNGIEEFDAEIPVTDTGNRIQPGVIGRKPDLLHVGYGAGGGSVYVNDSHPIDIPIPERSLGFVGGAKPFSTIVSEVRRVHDDRPILNRRGMFLLSEP